MTLCVMIIRVEDDTHSLLIIFKFRFTYGERKVCQNVEKSLNILPNFVD